MATADAASDLPVTPADHQRYMARALELARRGMNTTDPNPRVGCVVVNDGRVVGEGWHARAGGPHAEIVALDAAGNDSRGATVYVTLEPCVHHGRTGPCTEKLIDAGVGTVVAAMRDPNPAVSGKGFEALRAAGIAVTEGLLYSEAAAINPGFISRMTTGRPYVRLKLAMSLDGRTALAGGQSRWITGEEARNEVQHLRARSSAILTGIGTVLADDPRLDVRLDPGETGGGARQPLRVILDSHLRTPPTAKLFSAGGPVLIATLNARGEPAKALHRAGAELLEIPARAKRVSLEHLMAQLAERSVNEVHVECGATLAGALIDERLVDELVIYVAPTMFGSEAKPLASILPASTMEDRLALRFEDVRRVGRDIRLGVRLANRPAAAERD